MVKILTHRQKGELMNDLISRQAAIDALERIFDRCEEIEAHLPDGDPDKTGYKMFPDYMTVWKYLRQLPSAERRGRWIDIDSETYTWKVRCSNCGAERSMMSTQGRYPKFCEECGARMEAYE